MKVEEMRPGMLFADGRELLKVSTIYRNSGDSGDITSVTAQVLLVWNGEKHRNETPPRTTVRRYTPSHAETAWTEPSDLLVRKYDEAYGNPARQ